MPFLTFFKLVVEGYTGAKILNKSFVSLPWVHKDEKDALFDTLSNLPSNVDTNNGQVPISFMAPWVDLTLLKLGGDDQHTPP
jgi:hypothetical protein